MAEKSYELEDTSIDIIQSDVLRANKTEGKQSPSQRPRGSMKHTNAHGMGDPRGAKKDAGTCFGNAGDLGSIPGWGRSSGGGNGKDSRLSQNPA